MLLDLGLIAGGLVLLFFGADWLVRGAASLALRFGLSPLIVGLTVVAFGTSSPELLVSLEAAFAGSGDIALGNVIGSNITNFALILGMAALVRAAAVDRQLLRLDTPAVLAGTLLLLWFLSDQYLSRLEGGVLLAGLLAYLVVTIRTARRGVLKNALDDVGADDLPPPRGPAWKDAVLVALGLAVLVGGARLLVTGAVSMAEAFGWSQAFIGLTIVAVGTSLPELATSVVAAVRGEGDIAVGNVIGSNLFNILGILGLAAVVHPLQATGIAFSDLLVLVGVTVLTMGFMLTTRRVKRWEGAVLVAVYAAYVWSLLPG